MIKSHRDLKVWQAGMELSLSIYRLTESFPKSEVFGLVSQMRRAAISIPANIAEGFSRRHKTEFVQFLHIAKGSLSELDTFVCLCERLGRLDQQSVAHLSGQIEAVGKMIHGLLNSIRGRQASATSD